MEITADTLETLYRGFNTSFNKGLANAPSRFRDVAMVTQSETAETEYGWLGETPQVREWIGDRVLNSLAVHGYALKNRRFEQTVTVKRTTIEDDRFGVYGPVFEKFGRDVGVFPDELVFGCLASGFHEACYDGQPFFDAEHPVIGSDGETVVPVSNVQEGDGPAWFLLDCSQPIRPLIFQERIPFDFQRLDASNDPHVFFKDDYVYGTRGRCNAGYGLWQLAFGSRATLNEQNYEAARAAMHGLRGDNGKRLGISPTHLVVPTGLEGKARALLNATHLQNGASNVWVGSATLLMTSYVD